MRWGFPEFSIKDRDRDIESSIISVWKVLTSMLDLVRELIHGV